ncbi:MAG: peptide chain release factor N(5)-glutamine methyltransferase [Patescibacteria group bacterium]|nr:peptide chain release factor N(5)-glutamine methyltransferase [Patescibacteria group bacterium]
MNIQTAIAMTEKKLKSMNIPSPEIEAEAILSFVLRKNKEYLFTYPEKKISFWQLIKYQYFVGQRIKGIPLAYLTGHQEFYGLDFLVNKNVLIPRPETEILIDTIIENIRNAKCEMPNAIIDIGTGSGCIIVSLAKKLLPAKIGFTGLDISRKALSVARKNAKKNDVGGRIHFLYSDLLNAIDKNIFKEPVLITANLPYLTPEQIKNSPTIQKEPKSALSAGADGLDCYRRLFQQIKELSPFIKNDVFILCEIDDTQKNSMENLISQNFPRAKSEIIPDLGGFSRLAVIEL